MDQGSLVAGRLDVAKRFVDEFSQSFPVAIALLVHVCDEDVWDFYIASDQFNDGKLSEAYGEVLRIADTIREPLFDPFRVRLLGLDASIVRTALEFYEKRSPTIPAEIATDQFAGREVDAVYLIKGPTGGYTMPSGREVLDQIIDREAHFFELRGQPPRKIKLPILMAYDLAKCGRNELGDLSGKVFKDGISVFEDEGFHGMRVEIVRDRNAVLELE